MKKEFDMLADFFKNLGDVTRVRILFAISDDEKSVNEIAGELSMSQSAISHQLRILKQARLVRYRKEGKMAFYTLDDDHVKQIFKQGMVHINE
jgi:ArsR family transcriptional regulator